MRSLLNFLERYNNLIIFLILEGIAIYLLATRNYYHNTRAVNAARWLTYGIEEKISNTRSYLSLREINENLAAENTALRNSINRLIRTDGSVFFSVSDTVYQQQYQYTTARLTSNSVNKQKNFFTVNKGTLNGLGNDMAVIADGGVAGVIVGCSENFSVVMSLLNLDFRLSARIKSNGFFGSLSWDGRDYRKAILSDIPQHVVVSIGDTIETTGYSAVFPEGVIVGTVIDYEKPGSDFYKITVLLQTDFRKIHFVDVVANKRKKEFVELEKQIQ
jgi:rod shape-determining protein MreC